MSDQIDNATARALEAFWSEIARALPEATSGDLDPLSDHRFTRAAKEIVSEWIELNVPGEEHSADPETMTHEERTKRLARRIRRDRTEAGT